MMQNNHPEQPCPGGVAIEFESFESNTIAAHTIYIPLSHGSAGGKKLGW